MRQNSFSIKRVLALTGLFLFPNLIPFSYVDNELKGYLKEFKDEIKGCSYAHANGGIQFVMVFQDKLETELAYCQKSLTLRRIVIDKSFWDKLDYSGKYQIVMHELSHCYLNTKHMDKYPHYMNTYYDKQDFIKTKDELRKEIKEKCKL